MPLSLHKSPQRRERHNDVVIACIFLRIAHFAAPDSIPLHTSWLTSRRLSPLNATAAGALPRPHRTLNKHLTRTAQRARTRRDRISVPIPSCGDM